MTRIFRVAYYYVETYDGQKSEDVLRDRRDVEAVDALDAINKVGEYVFMYRETEEDSDTGKMTTTARVDFDPIGVELLAETDED